MAYTMEDLMAFLQTGTKAPPTKNELAALAAQLDKMPLAEREALLRLLQELAEKGPTKVGLQKTNEAYWAKVQQAETQKLKQKRKQRDKKWEDLWSKALLIKKDKPDAEAGMNEETEPLQVSEEDVTETALPEEKPAVVEAAELIAPEEPDTEPITVHPTEKELQVQAEILADWDVMADDRFITVMKSYENGLYAALQKIQATDKGIADFQNSSSYRQFRGALKKYIDQISNPNCWPEMGILPTDSADDIRRKWADTTAFYDLEDACVNYLNHCQDTYEKNTSPRRSVRLRQTEDVRELLQCLKVGIDEPLDYARYKLAERAIQGAGLLFKDSRDPETAEAGRRILEDLNGNDVARQQKQVYQIYNKKAFRGFTRTLDFSTLCELRRGEPAEVVNRCHKLQVEWSMERTKNTPAAQPTAAETGFCVLS